MKLLIVLLALVAGASAETKLETELKAKLAASEAARLALTNAVSKQATANKETVTARKDAKSDRDEAAVTAAVNANAAQMTADVNATIAQRATEVAAQAALQAASAAGAARAQNVGLMITQLFGFGTLLAGFIYKFVTDTREHAWAAEHAANVIRQIDVAKKSADEAFKEANAVNTKIAKLGLKTADGSLLKP